MVGLVALADPPRELELVVVFLAFVADRERRHRTIHQLAHQRDVHRRVDAARQQHAERHVGDHPPRDRLPQQSRQFGDRLGFAEIALGSA